MFRTPDGANHLPTFLPVCGLFCLSGLWNGMIDVLNEPFPNSLQVSKARSAFVQGFWYAGYFLLALPAGMFARRHGYRGGIVFGLAVIAVGWIFGPLLGGSFILGLVFLSLGWMSVVALVLSFFFMSIMYPTHFGLAIRGLGERTKLASSGMVTAVVGGAIMPVLMGWLADHYSMRVGFLMPMVCFACITAYGCGWRRLHNQDMEPEA